MPKSKSAYYRSKARSLALQGLYEADVSGHPIEACLGWLTEETSQSEPTVAYALEIMRGVRGKRDEIDEFIHKFAPAWPVKQLPVVDRNILRLALFEIRFGSGVPHKAAVNEAVELAKSFGSESSPRFINGVLGSAMDEMAESSIREVEPSPVAANNTAQEGT
jgi:N utilization substance protein B